MPLSAMATPLSLYMIDNTIFNGLELPTMPTNPTEYPDLYVQGFELDRDVLVNNLLMETGEMDVIYPEPDFFKYAVTQWSKKELPVWQALYNTLFYRYNPLWNKDGTVKESARDLTDRITSGSRSRSAVNGQTSTDTIDETDTHNLKDTRTPDLMTSRSDTSTSSGTSSSAGSDSVTETHSGAITSTASGNKDTSSATVEGEIEQKTTGTVGQIENKVSAYNDSAYQNRDKNENSTTETLSDNRNRDQTATGSETTSDSKTEVDNRTIGTSTTTGSTKTDESAGASSSDIAETGTEVTDHTGTLKRTGTNGRTVTGSEGEDESTTGTDSGSLEHELERKEYGNIGVTMTTALIQAQRDLVQLNFYSVVIDSFKERFCLLVY